VDNYTDYVLIEAFITPRFAAIEVGKVFGSKGCFPVTVAIRSEMVVVKTWTQILDSGRWTQDFASLDCTA
jgi:hypothetical protein